jgi:hypothetical protein
MKKLSFIGVPLLVLLLWLGWRWMGALRTPHVDKPSMAILKGDGPTKIYATDTGLGFRPGAPEPTQPTPQQAPIPGRLPTTPPPRPQP